MCALEEGFRVGGGEEVIDNNADNVIVLVVAGDRDKGECFE